MAYSVAIRLEFEFDDVPLPWLLEEDGWKKCSEGYVLSETGWSKMVTGSIVTDDGLKVFKN